MKMLELLNQNEKVAKTMRDHFSNIMYGSADTSEFSIEFKQFLEDFKVDNARVADIIETNPRTLFDFFDHNNVIISTPVVWKEGSHSFLCEIDGVHSATSFKTRREAEMYAIENAIALLEGRLNSN